MQLKARFEYSFENVGIMWPPSLQRPRPVLEFSPKSTKALRKLHDELLEIKNKRKAELLDISLSESSESLTLLVRLNGSLDKKLCPKGCSCHYEEVSEYKFGGFVVQPDIFRFLREEKMDCEGPEKCDFAGSGWLKSVLCPQNDLEIVRNGLKINPECYLNSLPPCKNSLVKSVLEKFYQASREN